MIETHTGLTDWTGNHSSFPTLAEVAEDSVARGMQPLELPRRASLIVAD